MTARCCKYSADSFYYVCGEFFPKKAKKHALDASIRAKEAYLAYFEMPVGDQDKRWAPHVICEYCRRTLEGWLRGEKRFMRFAIPRIWREPSDHHTDCYFCTVDPTKRRKGKNAPPIEYPDIPLFITPVPHNNTDLVFKEASQSFLATSAFGTVEIRPFTTIREVGLSGPVMILELTM